MTPGVVPAPPGAIEQLEPAQPSSTPSDSGSAPRGASSAGKTNYEALRATSRAGPSRGENLARALVSSEPARRPAPGGTRANPTNPLDNLPPLNLPIERTNEVITPPVAPEASALPTPAPEIPTGAGSPAQSAAPKPEATAPAAEAGATVIPGIKRFQGLEPKLAGGSLPSLTGLDWLDEKGYKTLLDLREPGPDQPAYIAEATKRGFRYLPLPITAAAIDPDHVQRFNAELDQADARPLYFFDTEGDRAGAMWYIRRLTVDKVKVDAKTARQEAQDLGLSDQKYWVAASAYLERLAPVKPSTNAATAAATPSPAQASSQPPAPAPPPATPPPNHAAALTEPPAASAAPRDSTAWKPFAALLVTGLGLPLAYLGRCSIFSLGAYVRASLPAPERSLKALTG